MTDEHNLPEDRYGFRGGRQYHPTKHLDYSLVVKDEKIWFDMINNWDNLMSKSFNKVKKQCRKGIPQSIRPILWQLLSGSYLWRAKDSGYMEELINKEADPENIDMINTDIHRCFTHHKLFIEKNGPGQTNLFKLLKAYSTRQPIYGYCQPFGALAAFFLINMTLLDAFWCFATINDYYIPGYCEKNNDAALIDCRVTMALLEKSCPIAYKHLKMLDADPFVCFSEWYVTLYTRTLPWPTLLRVWDMFICEGMKVMFAVAVTIVKQALGTKEKVDAAPGFFECLSILKKTPFEYLEENTFIPMVIKLNISAATLAKEQKNQMKILMKEKVIPNQKDSQAINNQNNSAFTPLEKLSICRVPSKTPTLPLPQRQDASTDTAVDQTTALLARMPAAGDMDGNGVSGGVCGDIADEVDGDDVCGYDDSEDIGNNIVDGECGDYKDSINEVAIENK